MKRIERIIAWLLIICTALVLTGCQKKDGNPEPEPVQATAADGAESHEAKQGSGDGIGETAETGETAPESDASDASAEKADAEPEPDDGSSSETVVSEGEGLGEE